MEYIVVNKLITKSIYKQIADSITIAIESGDLQYNDKLPTEKEICEIFSISQTAVKMAYEKLIQEGKIKRIKGKGTYVTNRKAHCADIHTYYTFEVDEEVTNKVFLLERSTKDSQAKRELSLKQNDKYIHIASLFKKEDNNLLYQNVYLPMDKFKNVDEKIKNYKHIYDLIENHYQYTIKDIHTTYNAVNASSSEAMILQIERDEALYQLRSKIIDTNDQVIAYIVNYYPGEFTELEVTVYAI